MNRDEIGVGIIGTSFMGKAHGCAYQAYGALFDGLKPRIEVICSSNLQRAEQTALSFGASKWTNSWQDVIEDPTVQLVSICTPNNLHGPIAIAALQAGKHIWCEKPMGSSFTDAEQMVEAAQLYPRQKVLLGYNYTKSPLLLQARQLIDQGVIGCISGFFCRYDVNNDADEKQEWSWRMSKAQSGPGANADVLSHGISIAHFLLDDEICRVVGDYHIVHPQRQDQQGNTRIVDNDDMVAALVHFNKGAHGHIGASRVSWGKKCGLRFEVHGTKGSIMFDQERMNELQLFTADNDPALQGYRRIISGPEHPNYKAFLPNGGHSLGYLDMKTCELRELLQAIEMDLEPWPNFADGYAIERVVYGIDRSAEEQSWVSLGSEGLLTR